MRRFVVLVILLLIIAAAWFFRDTIVDRWREFRGIEDTAAVPSEELAESAAARLEELRTGQTDRVALGSAELQSLLQYRYQGLLPAFAGDPEVALEQDRMRLRVRVPIDQLPDMTGLGDVASFLPDTTEVALTGSVLPLDSGRVALAVSDVQAARFPLPDRMINDALRRVGRRDEPGLPQDAIAVRLPAGVRAVYIRNDSIVFLSRPGT